MQIAKYTLSQPSTHGSTNLTFQDVETDAAELVDVRVVDFRDEADLRRAHRVVFRQEKFEFEDAALEWGTFGS